MFPISPKETSGRAVFSAGNCKVGATKSLKKLVHSQMLPSVRSCVSNPLFRFGDLGMDTLCKEQKLSSGSVTLAHPLTFSGLSCSIT